MDRPQTTQQVPAAASDGGGRNDGPGHDADRPRRRRVSATPGGRGRRADNKAATSAKQPPENAAPAIAAPAARLVVEVGHATTRYWLRPSDPREAPTTGALPSAVTHHPATGWCAGEGAARGRLMAADAALLAPTRLLGRPAAATPAAALSDRGAPPSAVTDGGDAALTLRGHTVRPELATAALLAEVRARLVAAEQKVPDDVVLLVPADADFAARRAYAQAAALAGLPSPRLAHAPWGAARLAAQALAAQGRLGTLCVVDLGAHGASATVLTVTAGGSDADTDEVAQTDASTNANAVADAAVGAGPNAATKADAHAQAGHDAGLSSLAAPNGPDAADAEEAGTSAASTAAVSGDDAHHNVASNAEARADAAATADAEAEARADAAVTSDADVGGALGGTARPDATAARRVMAAAGADADRADEASNGQPAADADADADADVDVADGASVDVSPAPPALAPAPPTRPLRLEVRALRGGVGLGGEAIDAAVVGWLRDGYIAAHDVDPAAIPLGAGRLWSAAERARRALDAAPQVDVHLPHLTAAAAGTHHLTATLRRDELAALAAELTQRVVALCRSACRAAGRELREVDGWTVVGGLAGAHHLVQALRRAFHRAPLELIDPATAAVAGAALAPVPIGEPQEACVSDLARTLPDGGEEVLVAAGTPLPASASFVVTTRVDEQDLVRVPLHLGAADGELAWRDAGRLEVDDLPPAPAGKVQVTLELTLGADMQLHARASAAGRALPVRHLHVAGLSEDRLARLAATEAAAAEARARQAQLEALRQDAQALLAQTAALGAGVLGSEADDVEDVADEDAALAAAEATRREDLREALRAALDALGDNEGQAGEAEAPEGSHATASAARTLAGAVAPDAEVLATLAGHVRALRAAASRATGLGAATVAGA